MQGRGRGSSSAPCSPFGGGSPQQQRRGALDFLSRALRDLEIEAAQARAHEARAERLEDELRRAKAEAAMFSRRCDMLEHALKKERELHASGCGSAGAARPPKSQLSTPTSLSAAAARLPPPPGVAADDLLPGAEDDPAADDFDIDALIAEQQAMPLPEARRPPGQVQAPLLLRREA